MRKEILDILNEARETGWVMEPRAKEILRLYGLGTTKFRWVKDSSSLLANTREIGYPVAMKVVSKDIVHKTEAGGVSVGIKDDERLITDFNRMSSLPGFSGVLIDEMASGIELIIGSKNDPQFGTVVLMGIGGTSVEIYRDVAIRLAPVKKETVVKALGSLKAERLLKGYRGAEPVNIERLSALISKFSKLAHELSETIESIDCNPVFCNSKDAVIADARIMLR